MLICERANIAFVQIPKNGSKSIRKALLTTFGLDHSQVARDLGWTVEQFEQAYADGVATYLPELGKNNLDHLTLAIYRELLPEAFAAFCSAQSFALIREPRERFFSALLQRLGQFRHVKGLPVDDPLVAEEARQVCDWLDSSDASNDHQYIHFARQIDYVDLDGERLVNVIFPIESTDLAEDWIEYTTGTRIDISHDHARREPKPITKLLYNPARFVARRFLTQGIRKIIHPFWSNSALFDDAAKRYDSTHLGEDVEEFVKQYYAEDALLYQEACERVDKAAKPVESAAG